jgi:hypothetical protein
LIIILFPVSFKLHFGTVEGKFCKLCEIICKKYAKFALPLSFSIDLKILLDLREKFWVISGKYKNNLICLKLDGNIFLDTQSLKKSILTE